MKWPALVLRFLMNTRRLKKIPGEAKKRNKNKKNEMKNKNKRKKRKFLTTARLTRRRSSAEVKGCPLMPRGHVTLTLSRLARWVGVANALRPCEGLRSERESVAGKGFASRSALSAALAAGFGDRKDRSRF